MLAVFSREVFNESWLSSFLDKHIYVYIHIFFVYIAISRLSASIVWLCFPTCFSLQSCKLIPSRCHLSHHAPTNPLLLPIIQMKCAEMSLMPLNILHCSLAPVVDSAWQLRAVIAASRRALTNKWLFTHTHPHTRRLGSCFLCVQMHFHIDKNLVLQLCHYSHSGKNQQIQRRQRQRRHRHRHCH